VPSVCFQAVEQVQLTQTRFLLGFGTSKQNFGADSQDGKRYFHTLCVAAVCF